MEELALLPEATRRALEGAAVAGDPFEPELAAAAAGMPEQETIGALDELLRRDLVRSTDVPRRFRFRHPLGPRRCLRSGAGRLATAGARAGRRGPGSARRVCHRARSPHRALRPGRGCECRGNAGRGRGGGWRSGRPPPPRGSSAARSGSCAAGVDRRTSEAALALARRPRPRRDRFQPAHASGARVPRAASPRLERDASCSSPAACAGLENLLGRHEEAHARLMSALGELSGMRARPTRSV